MSHPVVIDLISSPELPVRRAKTATKPTSVAKALDFNDHDKHNTTTNNNEDDDHDEWFRLSSDDGPSLPKPKGKAKSTARPQKRSPSVAQPAASVTSAKIPKSRPELEPEPAAKQKIDTNDLVVILSDDFDSTVVLSDPFATELPSLPLAKRRRVSSSPQATSSKDVGAGGYARERWTTETSISRASVSMKKSTSNIETTTPYNSTGLKKSKSVAAALDSDPIVFTSSPNVFAQAAKKRKAASRHYEDEDDEVDIFEVGLKVKGVSGLNGSSILDIENSSDFDLPDIGEIPMGSLAKGDTRAALRKYNAEKAVGKKPKPPSKSKVPKVSEEEKQAAKSKKLAAKEVDKEQKRIAREEKAAAKEREKEFAKANTLTDKKNSTAQMIVDLPSCLDVRLGSHAKALLLPVGAELGEWESEISLIKWRRKVEAIYDEQAGHFVPCPKHIKDEMHIMYVMQANEFVSLATGPEGKDLDSHFLRLRAKYDGYTIIYLIEGLTPWMRKNKGVKNAQFQEAVRNMGQDEENSATQRRKPKKQAEYIDEDLIEDALLRLQVVHKPLIHHTNSAIETGQWVVAFTQHISTIPHRKLKDALDTTFSMESGQVKTGEDAADTYLRMLSELKMVTAPVACGIAAEYPSVQKLIAGFEADGPLILEDCRKTANKDGALTDKRIGPAISKRVHRVFTGMDPWEMV